MSEEMGKYLEDGEVTRWVDYGDGGVLFRQLDVKDLVAVKRRATVGKKRNKPGRLDEILHNKYLAEKAVINWRDFVKKGKPLQFSQDALQKIMLKNIDFASFVNEIVINFAENLSEDQGESEKNSVSTSD